VLHFRRPRGRPGADSIDGRLQGCGIPPLGGDPAQLQQRREIARLGRKNFLDEGLKFRIAVGGALPLSLFCQLVEGAQVLRV